jgi:hypothetical protein
VPTGLLVEYNNALKEMVNVLVYKSRGDKKCAVKSGLTILSAL